MEAATGSITGTGDTIVDFGPAANPIARTVGQRAHRFARASIASRKVPLPKLMGAGFWDTLDVVGNAGGVAATINDTAKAFIDEASSAAKLAGDIGDGLAWFGLPLDILGTGNDIYNYFKDPDAGQSGEKLGTDRRRA